MPTLVLSPRYRPDSIALGKAADAAGWRVERLHRWEVPEHLRQEEVIPYGEPMFVAFIAEQLALALIEPPLDWLTTLPFRYLERSIQFTTLAAARLHGDRAFFKPADDKCFAAGVYDSGDALPASELLPDDSPVLIADQVVWEVEYRCFVLDRKLAAIPPYWRDDHAADEEEPPMDEAREAARFVEELLKDSNIRMPPAFVLDIGRVRGTGWAVIEANPAWASGIYACDPSRVLPVLARATCPEATVSPADAAWVVCRDAEA